MMHQLNLYFDPYWIFFKPFVIFYCDFSFFFLKIYKFCNFIGLKQVDAIRNYKISIISSIYRNKISIFLFIDTKKLIDDFLSIIRYYIDMQHYSNAIKQSSVWSNRTWKNKYWKSSYSTNSCSTHVFIWFIKRLKFHCTYKSIFMKKCSSDLDWLRQFW